MTIKADAKLKTASANLSNLLDVTIIVVDWNCLERGQVDNEQIREDTGVMVDRLERQVRDLFPKTAEAINAELHRFAVESEPYSINAELSDPDEPLPGVIPIGPDIVIGTSAHHAAVLFLQRCIVEEFWKDNPFMHEKWALDILPNIKKKELKVRLHWERLRVFKTSEFKTDHTFLSVEKLMKSAGEKTVTRSQVRDYVASRRGEVYKPGWGREYFAEWPKAINEPDKKKSKKSKNESGSGGYKYIFSELKPILKEQFRDIDWDKF